MDSKQFERVKTAIGQIDAEPRIELEALVRHITTRRQGEIAVAQEVPCHRDGQVLPTLGPQ